MTDQVITITRTHLVLGDLKLMDTSPSGAQHYDVMALDGGQVGWRDQTVTSPYVHGAYETSAVLDDVDAAITVRVNQADSHTVLQSRTETLIEAFSQPTFTLTFELDGEEWAWECRRATYRMPFDLAMRRHLIAQVTFTFPRSPITVSGPY